MTAALVTTGAGIAPEQVQDTRPGFARRLAHKPLAVVSAAYLVAIMVACFLASVIAPYGEYQQNLFATAAGPSAAHLLGTDELGRDILTRLLYGGQITFIGVFEAVGTILVLSVPVGLAAGYFGGRIDRWTNNIVDLLLSIPSIVVVLSVLAVFASSMAAGMVTFGILGSAGVVRVVRSAVLTVREEPYIDAARLAGVRDWRIVTRHVMPRVAGAVIVQATLWSGIALGIQTGLAFLGVGITPPAPSWGGMVAEASQLIFQDAWMLVPTGGVIALTILAFALLGDAVGDAAQEGWGGSGRGRGKVGRGARRRSIHRLGAGAASADPGNIDPPPLTRARDEGVLVVAGLSVVFTTASGEVKVLDDVSFAVKSGEMLGVLGESGSGKSVTALAIMGLLPPTARVSAGGVFLEGLELTKLGERQMCDIRGTRVAMVFQDPMAALDPCFTVGYQIAEVVRRHDSIGRRAARERTLELLAQVRLPNAEQVARLYPHELSGGMAQRICIALALAGRPEVLIADEPTTALDVTVQSEILSLLRVLQQETGMSVLIVTHDWGVVADVCDRAVVMYAGQVVEEASVGNLFARAAHPYTRALQLCNPELAAELDVLPTIPGSVLRPEAWPVGCHFFERCEFATAECALAAVPIQTLDGHQAVRCLHWQRVRAAEGVGELK